MAGFRRPETDSTRRQGGDLRWLPDGSDYLDLSTCANRYGPPAQVTKALTDIDPVALRAHPYGAEDHFRSAYAEYLEVDAEYLVIGRGITEFIRILANILPPGRAAVLTPDYTDTVASFPVHVGPPDGRPDTAASRLRRLAAAMRRYDHVIMSNPNNPLGIYIHRDELTALCRAYPHCTLILDEAYIDFLAEPACLSMISAGLDNVVVLRSPNKLFGIAGVRAGALWSRNRAVVRDVRAALFNWPISYLDAAAAVAALESAEWAKVTRARLLATARDMEDALERAFGYVVPDVPVHYRFVPTSEPERVQRGLLESGIVARAFSAHEPGRIPGIRITAPAAGEFDQLKSALVAHPGPQLRLPV
jgi:histidinol-phosphate aminotransferase